MYIQFHQLFTFFSTDLHNNVSDWRKNDFFKAENFPQSLIAVKFGQEVC